MEPKESIEHHVAIISPYARTIVSFRGSLIRELVDCGCRVSVLAPDFTPQIRAEVAQLGAAPVDYPLDRTGLHPFRDLFTLWSLWKILRDIHPTIVLAYNIKPIIYGLLAGGRVERRVALIEGLGYAFTQTEPSVRQRILRYLVRQMYRIALKRAHAVLFLNPDDQREFCRLSLVSAEQAVLLGGIGVDLSEYMPASAVLEPITFTLAARLLREKGIVEFAQAAQRIKQHYPNTRFLLLGGLDTNPGALREHEVRQWAEAGILGMARTCARCAPLLRPDQRLCAAVLSRGRTAQHAGGDGDGASCDYDGRARLPRDGGRWCERLSGTAARCGRIGSCDGAVYLAA
jgi:glycosyltransferase involved in cell wall biosynthesis